MSKDAPKVTAYLETSDPQSAVITNHLRELQRWGKPVPEGVLSDLLAMGLVEMPPPPEPHPPEVGFRLVCMSCGLGWSPFDDRCPNCGACQSLDCATGKVSSDGP